MVCYKAIETGTNKIENYVFYSLDFSLPTPGKPLCSLSIEVDFSGTLSLFCRLDPEYGKEGK